VSWNSTAKITKEITNTYAQINQTYQEIKSTDGFNFQLPSMGMSLLIAISGVVLLGIVKKFFNLVLSGLITAIAINYLVLGTIDYFHSINDLVNWMNQNKPEQH
ncbi:MAG: hypothetical protein ACKPGH_01465, partial [Dolichospermum sp.]